MRRRAFLGAGAIALTSKTTSAAPAGKAGAAAAASFRLAGRTLAELRDLYRADIFDDYIPFHDKYVVDHQYGGYMLTVDRDGTQVNSSKRTWYEGRGIWTYSYLYNKVKPDPKYLEVARKSVGFIMKQNPLGRELMPAGYTKDGTPQGTGPDPIFYGDVFVANGLQEFAKAKGNEEYADIAKKILMKCVDIYDNRPGYASLPPEGTRAAPQQGAAAANAPRRNALTADLDLPGVDRPRITGHWMVLLNCAQQMLETRKDPEIEALAVRSAQAVMDHQYNPAYGLINEYTNHDLSRIANDHGQICIGHGPETLWMILYDAVRRKDKALFDRAAGYLHRSAEVFWDDVYGGMLAGLEHVDRNIWQVSQKSLWLQQEFLLGFLCVIEHTGAQWARDWYGKLHAHVMAKFPLKQYGFPLWIAYADVRPHSSANTTGASISIIRAISCKPARVERMIAGRKDIRIFGERRMKRRRFR